MTKSHTPNTPKWVADAIFYQIFPDRFAKSEKHQKPTGLQSWDASPTFHAFKGGDLIGVTERLEQIKDAGFNAIYFTPIFTSSANHRYATYNYFEVDPLLGGNSAFRKLIDKAHSLGIRIVIDGVFNHTGRGFFPFHDILENGAESPWLDWFHINPEWLAKGKPIDGYPLHKKSTGRTIDTFRDYGFRSWWNHPMLPKLNTDNPAVRTFIFDVAEHWIKFGVDGWRLDVPNDIDDDEFWREFRKRVKKVNSEAYIVGEIWIEADRWLQGDQFDGVMNYLLGREILKACMNKEPPAKVVERSVYAKHKPISPLEFTKRAKKALGRYHPNIVNAQMNLLTSHDTPRMASLFQNDEPGICLAFSLLFALPGSPCIFYGDEIAMEGNHDPDCRRAYPQKISAHLRSNPVAKKILNHIKMLSSVRSKYESMRRGTTEFFSSKNLIAFARVLTGHATILIIANPTDKTITKILELPVKPKSKIRVKILHGKGLLEPVAEQIQATIPARCAIIATI